MALSIQDAAAKWHRNAQAGAKNWHGDPAAYCEGLARFGLSPAQCQSGAGARYQQGIASVSPAGFAQRIAQTSPEKWARRWLEGLSR